MLDTTGRAVLIDFDSAFHIGEGRYGKLSHALYRHITDKVSHCGKETLVPRSTRSWCGKRLYPG